jgi:hypothetical protein
LRWPRWPRRTGLAAALAGLVLAGAATAAVVRPWDESPRANATNPGAEARILADPVLSELGWVVGGALGSPHISHARSRPSVTFPPGVTYQQAITRLYRSVTENGVLPPEVRVGPPLPAGKVVRYPQSAAEGITLDLQAPFGYDVPSGLLPGPSFSLPAGLTPEEISRRFDEARAQGRSLPRGARIHTGELAACQVLRPGVPSPPCKLSAPPPDPWEGPASAPVVAVPRVEGLSAGDAAAALERAGLRAYVLQVLTPDAARGRQSEGAPAPVSLDLVREESAWRKAVGVPLVLPEDERAEIGQVVGVFPAGGEQVRRGSRVVLAAVADDCAVLREDATLEATCVPGAETAREASAELRLAPWLYTHRTERRGGPFDIRNVRERPSLVFPAGVSRAEALRRLYVEAVLNGRLPAEATIAPPLPSGIVYRPAASAGAGVRIDLRAPFGYDARRGNVFNMGLSYRAFLREDEIARDVRAGRLVLLPTPLEEQVLPIPPLAPCQVWAGVERPATCPGAARRR